MSDENTTQESSASASSSEPAGVPITIVPWGQGSAPSLPSVDSHGDNQSEAGDSAIGGMSRLSSTASLNSSMYEHIEENGRTYHRFRQGKYMLPNDEQEQERLDLQHALFLISMSGQLHLAPIGDKHGNVLDIATGTGLWAIEFAQKYPNTRVLGTDLSAIQPLFVPPNCRFEIDDAEDEWIFSDKFTFIHGRALLSCFKDPPSVFRSAYDALEPGGYFEMQDMVFPFHFLGEPPVESALYKWFQIIAEGAARLGRPWTNVPNYKRWFEEIGFEDVQEKNFYFPVNAWAKGRYFKQIAVYAQADFLSGLEGLSLKVMGTMGYSAEAVKEMLVDVRRDVCDPDVHCYCPMNVVYGRKPLDAAPAS